MATTHSDNDTFVRYTSPDKTRLSSWTRFKRRVVHYMLTTFPDCVPCGTLPDNWEDWERDEAMRAEVAREMRSVRTERRLGEDDVMCAVREVAEDGGFAEFPSCGNVIDVVEPVADVVTIDPWLSALVDLVGIMERESSKCRAGDVVDCILVEEPPCEGKGQEGKRNRVRVHATFVSRIVVVLRARLGRLEPEPANQLLVNREYSRLLRKEEYGIRAIDIENHRRDVVNVYFSDLEYERVPLVRSRLPKWFKNLMGLKDPVARPLVC